MKPGHNETDPVACIHWEDVKSDDMVEQTLNTVVTLRSEVSPWLMILQVVPDGWDFPESLPGQFTSLGLFASAPRCVKAEPENPPKEEPVSWKDATGHIQDVWKSGVIEKAWG